MAAMKPGARLRRGGQWLMMALLITIVGGSLALGQDWPGCSSSACVSNDLQVVQVFVEAQSCIGSSRSGVLKAELSARASRYAVRLAGKVYAIGTGGATRLIDTVDFCLSSYTGTSSVTLDASLTWDCDEHLELRDVLVSWQSNRSVYPCETELPCSAMAPMCNYYGSVFAVAGSEPANRPPEAADNTVSTDEDTAHVFAQSEFGHSDPDGDPLDHIKITRLETNGELEVSGVGVSLNQEIATSLITEGRFTFTPFSDDYAAAYASFDFKVHDGSEYSSASYTMTIAVDPVNDPPVAQNQSRSVVEGTSTGPFALAISDPDDLLLDLICSCIDPPDRGTVAIADPAAHTVNYDANVGIAPTTDTFTYQVCDPDSACDTATVTITITAAPNDNPTVAAASQTTPEDTPITFQVSHADADGDPLTCTVSTPTHGTISPANWTISAPYTTKNLTYTPHTDFVGVDTVVISCTDGNGGGGAVSVEITVTRVNAPPQADAGGVYLGMVGEPVLLDARFSIDPNIEDTLQYRWDTNGDEEWDTEWLSSARVEYTYERPYRGRLTVEVRDLYLGRPNGTTDQASAFAIIESRPTQIAVSVYVDVNGNGEFDEGDVGLPEVALLLDGDVELSTGDDGTALVDDVAPGTHTISISEAGIAYLQERGFFLSTDTVTSVELQSGEWVALFFSPAARGFLKVNLGTEGGGHND